MEVFLQSYFNAIDLFSGAGGLSTGLCNAGISVRCAIEFDKEAAETYKLNHSETEVLCKDIRTISDEEVINIKKQYKINMLVGCPPCQGFSSLTKDKNDPRNQLVEEYIRFVSLLEPEVVMLENVPGIQKRDNYLFNKLIELLQLKKYKISYGVVQIADYGIPQQRKRFILIASKSIMIDIPSITHSNKEKSNLKRWVSVKDIFTKTSSIVAKNIKEKDDDFNLLSWHVVRNTSDINKKRMEYMKQGGTRFDIPYDLRPKCHQKSTGYSNVYTRMSADKPSPTITGGCTSISKGRFVHPFENRVISVLEAALIQTFPENYKFVSKSIEKVSTMIGNAFPCDFAEILGKHILKQYGEVGNE